MQHPIAAVGAELKGGGKLHTQVNGIPWQHLPGQEVLISGAERVLRVKNKLVKPGPLAGTGIDQSPGLYELFTRGYLCAIRDREVEGCAHASPVAGSFRSGGGSLGRGTGDGGNHSWDGRVCGCRLRGIGGARLSSLGEHGSLCDLKDRGLHQLIQVGGGRQLGRGRRLGHAGRD